MCYIFETNNNYYYAYTFIFRSFLGIRKLFWKEREAAKLYLDRQWKQS